MAKGLRVRPETQNGGTARERGCAVRSSGEHQLGLDKRGNDRQQASQ